jgi:hypothetical protein
MNKEQKKFCCIKCKYFSDYNGNIKQHLKTKKHIEMIAKEQITYEAQTQVKKQINNVYKCPNCVKQYKTKSGRWKHSQICKIVPVMPEIELVDTSNLSNEIKELKNIITEMVLNQQPTTINNNNNNYINIFLNDKCRNACDIKKFIAGIDFSKENYHNLLMDYVGGNAEIITKNYNNLPEFERPVYCFSGEDKHQQIAHIQHENNWIVEPELNWERQVQREQDEIEDDPEPNSMYSLVRLFDKKKMEYFDENYKQSHLYLSQRKFNKDCLDGNNQVKLINKIIEMATVDA